MIFIETKLKNAFIIESERIEDHRGFFARAWCKNEFKAHGLNDRLVQCNLSFNRHRGTIRGMHYQESPHEETKIVRCTRGAIYDVIIDLRRESATYLKWIGVELTAENRKMLYIPEGFAHGYQTLENNTEIFYLTSQFFSPESERGVCWDDPTFAIEWRVSDNLVISEKDRNWQKYAGDDRLP
jgi:dTDP-4-dehydrorhamnose 3,5-epimerase